MCTANISKIELQGTTFEQTNFNDLFEVFCAHKSAKYNIKELINSKHKITRIYLKFFYAHANTNRAQ